MDEIAVDFEDRDVVLYSVYTREPYTDEDVQNSDFSVDNKTELGKIYVDYTLEILMESNEKREILIDIVGPDYIQKVLGGSKSSSIIVIDREGKVALWQEFIDLTALRAKLNELTKN